MLQTESEKILYAFKSGQILAYPTEAVFGMGCDPDNRQAVLRLLEIKKRPVEKGLILVAASYVQLLSYVDDAAIPKERRSQIFSSWPGPVTWLLPKSVTAPEWVTGASELIAVRVSAHKCVQGLCETLGKPIISTSANISGQTPAVNEKQVKQQFGEQVVIISGQLGGQKNPSTIRNGLTGEVVRAG